MSEQTRTARTAWSAGNVAELSWWSERIGLGVLVVELAGFVAGVSGTPGAMIVVGVVFVASCVTAIVASLRHDRLRRRLYPDGPRVPASLRRLAPVLLAGRPVAPEDRAEAGRLAVHQLSLSTCTVWGTPGLAGVLAATTNHGQGHAHWNFWAVALVVLVVLSIGVVASAMRRNARWRRVLADPSLSDVPAVVTQA